MNLPAEYEQYFLSEQSISQISYDFNFKSQFAVNVRVAAQNRCEKLNELFWNENDEQDYYDLSVNGGSYEIKSPVLYFVCLSFFIIFGIVVAIVFIVRKCRVKDPKLTDDNPKLNYDIQENDYPPMQPKVSFQYPQNNIPIPISNPYIYNAPTYQQYSNSHRPNY